jgi:hypothetical protein
MSNRTRILFHSDLPGAAGTYIGNQALKVMETIAKTSAQSRSAKDPVWVSEDTWNYMGRPKYLKRVIKEGPIGSVRKFLLEINCMPSLSDVDNAPVFKDGLQKAQWLWDRLPPEVRSYSQLKVFRENRNCRWKRSLGNPAQWGWQPSKNPGPEIVTLKTPSPSGPLGTAPSWFIEPPIVHMHVGEAQFQETIAKVKADLQKRQVARPKQPVNKIFRCEGDILDGPEFFDKPSKSKIAKEPKREPKRLRLGIWS